MSKNNYKEVYVLTFELYFDTIRYKSSLNGHFFNVLIRHYDVNSNCSVNAKTSKTGKKVTDMFSKCLDVYPQQNALVQYSPAKLYVFDTLMPRFKCSKISTSEHITGVVYDIKYNSLYELMKDVTKNLENGKVICEDGINNLDSIIN